MAYSEFEPLLADRVEWAVAQLCHLVAAAVGGKSRLKLTDFMWKPPKRDRKRQQTGVEMETIFRTYADAYNRGR